MIDTRKIAIAAMLLFGLAACAPATRFEWGTYEPSLYAYYKDPSDKASYEKALTQAIAAGRKTGKVAPGLCAELGYMQLADGNTEEARASFEEEITLFPESRIFLTGIMNRMGSGQTRKEPTS